VVTISTFPCELVPLLLSESTGESVPLVRGECALALRKQHHKKKRRNPRRPRKPPTAMPAIAVTDSGAEAGEFCDPGVSFVEGEGEVVEEGVIAPGELVTVLEGVIEGDVVGEGVMESVVPGDFITVLEGVIEGDVVGEGVTESVVPGDFVALLEGVIEGDVVGEGVMESVVPGDFVTELEGVIVGETEGVGVGDAVGEDPVGVGGRHAAGRVQDTSAAASVSQKAPREASGGTARVRFTLGCAMGCWGRGSEKAQHSTPAVEARTTQEEKEPPSSTATTSP